MERDLETVLQCARPAVRDLAGYQSGEQPQSGKFIKLNTNENPYEPGPNVARAIASAVQQGLRRYPDARATAFRTAAAEKWSLDPAGILCGNGSDEILTILLRTFVDPGELVRQPSPTYVLYPVLAALQGAQTETIPFTPTWQLAEEFFRPAEGLKLVFLANPNSPSGTLVPESQIRRLCESLPCPVVVDEAYADFARTSCVGLVREYPNLIVTRTLSKSYALAGMRFGYVVARPELMEQMHKVRDSYNCDALAIAAATAALRDDVWLDQIVEKIRTARARLESELQTLGFDVTPSSANFVWCSHPVGNRQIYERLKQAQILVRYMNYESWGDGIRITVGTESQMDALITVLRRILATT